MTFYVFLAAESEFDIHFSPTHLDFAVQELEIFTFLKKMKKMFSAKVDYHYILAVFQCI